jgi:hypothetical protein
MERVTNWLKRVEGHLDGWGKGAWIAAFVLGFILFWPIGLAILGYTLWSGRMGCWKNRRKHTSRASGSTGNTAFDDYRAETLRRLEDEQDEFKGFLDRLRRAKDKAELDEFLAQRRRGTGPEGNPQAA